MLYTVSHVLTFEDRLRKIQNRDYDAAVRAAWWDEVMVELPSSGRIERMEWLLSTFGIHELEDGTMKFDDLVTQAHEIENKDFGNALRVSRNQFEDDEAKFATEWASGMGAAMALHPQKLAAQLILNGKTWKGYDGLPYFHNAHPVNPFDDDAGTYSNIVTGKPLVSGGVVQPQNFADAVARAQTFNLPNGETRDITPFAVFHSPSLRYAARTVTGAKIISQTDNVLSDYDIRPITIPGLEVEPNVYYIAATEGGELSKPLIYQRREAFKMTTYDGISQAELSRTNRLEWHVRGRAAGAYGHPYLLIRVEPS